MINEAALRMFAPPCCENINFYYISCIGILARKKQAFRPCRKSLFRKIIEAIAQSDYNKRGS